MIRRFLVLATATLFLGMLSNSPAKATQTGHQEAGTAPPEPPSKMKEGAPQAPDPDALLQEGESMLENGNYGGASRTAKQVLEIKPNDARGELLLGRALLAQDRILDSIRHLRRAKTIDPDDPQCFYYLGKALELQKKTDEAIQAYRAALEADPDYARAHYYLGQLLYYEKNEKEAAVKHWEKAAELHPENGLTFKYLGAGYAYLGQFAKAKKALLRAQELEPNDFQVTSMLQWMDQNLAIRDETPQ